MLRGFWYTREIFSSFSIGIGNDTSPISFIFIPGVVGKEVVSQKKLERDSLFSFVIPKSTLFKFLFSLYFDLFFSFRKSRIEIFFKYYILSSIQDDQDRILFDFRIKITNYIHQLK